jgi:hypothetical protein
MKEASRRRLYDIGWKPIQVFIGQTAESTLPCPCPILGWESRV